MSGPTASRRPSPSPRWRSPAPHPHHGHHGHTIKLTEAHPDAQPTFVDTGKPGPTVGDVGVFRDDALRADGSTAGTLRQVCTLVDLVGGPPTSTFECVRRSLALKEHDTIAHFVRPRPSGVGRRHRRAPAPTPLAARSRSARSTTR